jgi:hypothetical protein
MNLSSLVTNPDAKKRGIVLIKIPTRYKTVDIGKPAADTTKAREAVEKNDGKSALIRDFHNSSIYTLGVLIFDKDDKECYRLIEPEIVRSDEQDYHMPKGESLRLHYDYLEALLIETK